jgi:hypothetical protein
MIKARDVIPPPLPSGASLTGFTDFSIIDLPHFREGFFLPFSFEPAQ